MPPVKLILLFAKVALSSNLRFMVEIKSFLMYVVLPCEDNSMFVLKVREKQNGSMNMLLLIQQFLSEKSVNFLFHVVQFLKTATVFVPAGSAGTLGIALTVASLLTPNNLNIVEL